MEIINNNDFEEKTKEGKVVIDFFAEWCGPCKQFLPVIEEVSEEIKTCKFYKVNVDENSNISQKFGIMSIPTVVILNNGNEINRHIGAMDKDSLISFIEEK